VSAMRYLVVWRPVQEYHSAYDVIDTRGKEGRVLCTAADSDAAHQLAEALNDRPDPAAEELATAKEALGTIHRFIASDLDKNAPTGEWAHYYTDPAQQALVAGVQHYHEEPF
jgi:hypothetical protein